MRNSKLEYKPFDFYDTDSQIGLCHDLAFKKLEEIYNTKYKVDSCDCFGIYIIDSDSSYIVTQFSTGRLGKTGPLAMRNEQTKEVIILVKNEKNDNIHGICSKYNR